MGLTEQLTALRARIEHATAELHDSAAQLHDLSLQLGRDEEDSEGVLEDVNFIDSAQQRIEHASRCLLDHVDALAEEAADQKVDQTPAEK